MPSKKKSAVSNLITNISSNTMVRHVLKKLASKSLLKTFSQHYLDSLPDRSLSIYKPDDLAQFLKERYSFFIEHSAVNQSYFEIHRASDHGNDQDTFAFELVCPDARFLLITLELLLQKHDAKITKMYHPIMQIIRKKGTIVDIKKPSHDTELRSTIYIEFELHNQNEQLVSELIDNISQKLSAIQVAQQDHNDMLDLLMSTKADMTTQFNPVSDYHKEWVDLLDWLKDYNFSFYGYCALDISNHKAIKLIPKSGKGILSSDQLKQDPKLLTTLKQHVSRLSEFRSPFIFDTLPYQSPIQRFENLMRLSIKIPISKTKTIEHNFVGLLKRSSLLVKNQDTPIIRLRMATIIEKKHLLPGSYDYNHIIKVFTSTPKFELFRTPTEQLYQTIDDLLSITNPNDIYVFTRKKLDPTQTFLLAVIPPQLFTKFNISRIKSYLISNVPHSHVETIEAVGDHVCRIHFHFDQPDNANWEPPCNDYETHIKKLVKPWEELFRLELLTSLPQGEGKALYNKYLPSFPPHHRVRRTPQETIRDIRYLEELEKTNQIQFNIVPFIFPDSVLYQKASILFIYNKEKIDLINIMPILQNLGIHVYDELTTRIGSRNEVVAYIHSFRVAHKNEALSKIDETKYKPLLISLLNAIFQGKTTNDPLNALAMSAQLTWQEINLLKTYRAFLLQIDTSFSKEKINATLLKHTNACQLLISYFKSKFDPSIRASATKRLNSTLPTQYQSFLDIMRKVSDINEDILLKRFFCLMEHTLRTNYFISKETEHFISIKLNSQHIKMPLPVPYREIFVYDAEMEGCHLRFGPVARGGLRWSNRLDDFRREVLGLVKTQQTKNVVIVPVGSKGGFVIKKPITANNSASESKKQYQKFIKGLLDITDNINPKGKTVHPDNVIYYDDPDPYLVVAADKGTASFSDYANDISTQYNFWLGDAFASGGSIGYNHKEVGITAKGAWECVKLHFNEMNINCQKDPFTVAGIGDMSGDVFGNGMLLSKAIKLQAAFNHIHIFLDPNPSLKESWDERYRLFHLPRSTWTDYNKALISKGGGIFDRHAKEIKLSTEVKKMLNISDSVLSGEALISAILKMQVDLIWFGGIGTYIKSEDESPYQVGDPANDSVRINHTDCHAKVIGEGANLGVTQSARIELSRKGTRLNTDFIDNSAGVNMSDYEVNIKILLQHLLLTKKVKNMSQRNTLLSNATDEVTELVLANNRGNHQLISMDQIRSQIDSIPFFKLINHMINTKQLNPIQENIPDQAEIETIFENKEPLPRPLLATLQSYIKMAVYNELIESSCLTDDSLSDIYLSYFPTRIHTPYQQETHNHRLKKEITCTLLTNMIVNQSGMSFFYNMEQFTGKSVGEITLAYLIIDTVIEGPNLRDQVLSSTLPMLEKYYALLSIENTMQDLIIELLQAPNISLSLSIIKPIQKIKEVLLPKPVSTTPEKSIQNLSAYASLCDLFYLHHVKSIPIQDAIQLLSLLDTTFNFKWIKDQLHSLSSLNAWELSQKNMLLQTLRLIRTYLIQHILSHTKSIKKISKDDIISLLKTQHSTAISTYFHTLQQMKTGQNINLTSLSVTINKLSIISLADSHT